MAAASWLSAGTGGIRIRVKVTPRAATSALRGIEVDAAGDAWLAVGLRAAPEDGRANAELVRLLARRWRVPAQRITLVRGATARRKVLCLEGGPDQLHCWRRRIEADVVVAGESS